MIRRAAHASIERSHTLNPYPVITRFYESIVLDAQHRHAEARESMRRARDAEPDTPFELWDLRLRRVLINFSGLEKAGAGLRRLWAETEPGTAA